MYNVFLSATPTIDEGVFSTISSAAETVLGLFTTFPLNIFLALSVLGVAVGIVMRLKRS